MRKELEGLIKAPIVDPTVGPALLTGRAAAVFFHEVFGHRAEGHRQKDVSEGQTFSKKVGEQILPPFLSITDDTTMRKLGGQDLLGYYQFDDEGVPAERVTLVDHGVLKSFEMSRSPLVGFQHSNGQGRVQLGGTPLAALTKIVATGDKPEVFNGYCGAESGSVPVAAASPAILISEMEVQKKETSTDRPPILPPPAHDTVKTGGAK